MSTAYFYTGGFADAETALRRTIRLQEQLGCSSQLPESLFLLGWSLINQGRYEEARECAEEAARVIPDSDPQPQHGLVLSVLGAVSLIEGKAAQARDLLIRAVDELGAGWQVDWHGRRSAIQAVLVCSLCHLQDLDGARRQLTAALTTALQVRSLIAALMLIPAAALFWLKRGDTPRALEIYSVARAQPLVVASRWFDQIVDIELREAESLELRKARPVARQYRNVNCLWQMAEHLCRELSQEPTGSSGDSSRWNPGTPTSAQTSPGPEPANRSEKNAAFVT
jgi:hypothetical protein